MTERTRLRQVVLASRQLAPVVSRLERELQLAAPFNDPGVGTFGLENAVFSIGDCFIEVVSPIQADAPAARYLDRQGGDSGYMAIFQVPDMNATDARLAELGVRVVWQADHPDISGRHLHPKDVPGAIVSLDKPNPPESWRWGGPAWTETAPDHSPGGVLGMTVQVADPTVVAERWASVLGLDWNKEKEGASITLDEGKQRVEFKSSAPGEREGIVEFVLATPLEKIWKKAAVGIAGVRFLLEAANH